MAKDTNGTKKQTVKAKPGMSLHKFIATGGKPKDFQPCKGVSDATVPGWKGKKGENY